MSPAPDETGTMLDCYSESTDASVPKLSLLVGHVFFGMTAGFSCVVIGILTLVLGLGVRIPLQTGIRFIDSTLYSLGNWTAIVGVAILWGILGALAGVLIGVLLFLPRWLAQRR